jgi:hypothetical protein
LDFCVDRKHGKLSLSSDDRKKNDFNLFSKAVSYSSASDFSNVFFNGSQIFRLLTGEDSPSCRRLLHAAPSTVSDSSQQYPSTGLEDLHLLQSKSDDDMVFKLSTV